MALVYFQRPMATQSAIAAVVYEPVDDSGLKFTTPKETPLFCAIVR